jgi:hypothetical protein
MSARNNFAGCDGTAASLKVHQLALSAISRTEENKQRSESHGFKTAYLNRTGKEAAVPSQPAKLFRADMDLCVDVDKGLEARKKGLKLFFEACQNTCLGVNSWARAIHKRFFNIEHLVAIKDTCDRTDRVA